ncbi:MAG: class I SAM-dependent methyltransferase [Cyanobacteria bacterium P01_H01_bin.130]
MARSDVVALTDVPETMLWTLHNRAGEAMRQDAILSDPRAVEIYQAIDYDYERNFGPSEPSHALRSLAFDQVIVDFLERYPDAVIVNLGEGLETQRFRIQAPDARWFSVDLPEAIATREKFIQPDDSHQHLALSALDRAWMAQVPKDKPVIITAQGLFMYFQGQEVRSLMEDIFKAFSPCWLVFDTIPQWLSNKTMSDEGWARTEHYTTPKMPWGINRNTIPKTLGGWLGDQVNIEDLGYPYFTREMGWRIFSLMAKVPFLRTVTPTIIRLSSPQIP